MPVHESSVSQFRYLYQSELHLIVFNAVKLDLSTSDIPHKYICVFFIIMMFTTHGKLVMCPVASTLFGLFNF